MLPKKHRFPLKEKWRQLQKKGRIYQFPFFGLVIAKNNLAYSRFAFIVSNKIHKRATQRNRIKRILREAVRSFLEQIRPGFDVVFLVKKTIVGKDSKKIKKSLKWALQKAQLFLVFWFFLW